MTRLTWWGHATTLIEVDGVRLLTDPLLRPRVGPLRQTGWRRPEHGRVDAVLISHAHLDHLDLPSLGALPAGVPVVAPPGAAARTARRGGARPVRELGVGESLRVGGVVVTATPAVHPEGRWSRTLGPGAVGYWVAGSRTVYFAGDTATFPGMADLAGADLAAVPVGGWGLTHGPGHMDAEEAAEALRLLRPGAAAAIHWGTLRIPALWRLRAAEVRGAGERFRAHAARVAPDVEVRVLPVGGSVTLPDAR